MQEQEFLGGAFSAERLVPIRIDGQHDLLLNQIASCFGVQIRLVEERMHREKKRLARERLTMSKMIGMYCSTYHESSGDILCAACQEFLDYAEARLQKCPYGEDKPICANCPIHCYKRDRREQIREMMRYAGPRMLGRHPSLAFFHLIVSLFSSHLYNPKT